MTTPSAAAIAQLWDDDWTIDDLDDGIYVHNMFRRIWLWNDGRIEVEDARDTDLAIARPPTEIDPRWRRAAAALAIETDRLAFNPALRTWGYQNQPASTGEPTAATR